MASPEQLMQITVQQQRQIDILLKLLASQSGVKAPEGKTDNNRTADQKAGVKAPEGKTDIDWTADQKDQKVTANKVPPNKKDQTDDVSDVGNDEGTWGPKPPKKVWSKADFDTAIWAWASLHRPIVTSDMRAMGHTFKCKKRKTCTFHASMKLVGKDWQVISLTWHMCSPSTVAGGKHRAAALVEKSAAFVAKVGTCATVNNLQAHLEVQTGNKLAYKEVHSPL